MESAPIKEEKTFGRRRTTDTTAKIATSSSPFKILDSEGKGISESTR